MIDKQILRDACKASYRDIQRARNSPPDAGGPKPNIRYWAVVRTTHHNGKLASKEELGKFRTEQEARSFYSYQPDQDCCRYMLGKGHVRVSTRHSVQPVYR